MLVRLSLVCVCVCVREEWDFFHAAHAGCLAVEMKSGHLLLLCVCRQDLFQFSSLGMMHESEEKKGEKTVSSWVLQRSSNTCVYVCVRVFFFGCRAPSPHRRRKSNWQTCTSLMSIFRHSQRFVVKSLSPCLVTRKEKNSSSEVYQHSPVSRVPSKTDFRSWRFSFVEKHRWAPFAHLSSWKKLIVILIRMHRDDAKQALLFFIWRRTNLLKSRCYLLRLTCSIELERKKSRELFDGWISKNVIRRGRREGREGEKTKCMLFSFFLLIRLCRTTNFRCAHLLHTCKVTREGQWIRKTYGLVKANCRSTTSESNV